MNSENKINNDIHPEAQVVVETSVGRRKLIRGGMIGVPVLLALKSAPVLACNCKMPSGFSVSGNLSQTGKAACKQPALKPTQIPLNESLRQKKFAGNVNNGDAGLVLPSGFQLDYKLGQALSAGGDLALVAAAYINATKTVFSPGVTNAMVRNMWNQTANGGVYVPTTGVTWTRTDVISYLNYVMAM